jgi:CHAT domain-containing protein
MARALERACFDYILLEDSSYVGESFGGSTEIYLKSGIAADWVVLSACNTAGGEASNSEAFSGLARAFFYAGTRALLVSHWPVSSDAAVAITTGATRGHDVTSRYRRR